jgi:uncharacterized membrane protein YoaK (UPF0700 family)
VYGSTELAEVRERGKEGVGRTRRRIGAPQLPLLHPPSAYRLPAYNAPVISKLPRWVWLGAWLLSFVAGMVNVVGLLGFEHDPVSHLTGSFTRLGISAMHGDIATLWTLALLIGAFLIGAILSGCLIQTSALQIGRHYGTVLLLETFLLMAAISFLQHHSRVGFPLLCMACGLQNAMASTYSGAIVRTTHMTGVFTDFGVLLGQMLRGSPADWRRICLFGSILGGFLCGGAMGAVIFPHLAYKTLLVPAALTGIMALGYVLFDMSKRQSS